MALNNLSRYEPFEEPQARNDIQLTLLLPGKFLEHTKFRFPQLMGVGAGEDEAYDKHAEGYPEGHTLKEIVPENAFIG